MTVTDFKNWLEGFSEAIDGAPTPEQWAKVKAKFAEVQIVTFPPMPLVQAGNDRLHFGMPMCERSHVNGYGA